MRHHTTNCIALLVVSIGITLLLFTACQSGNANGTTTQAQQSPFAQAQGSPISLPCAPGNVVIADMNNDKKPDLVVACGQTKSVLVLPGKGDGQFGAAVSTTTVSDAPGEMAVGGVNSDGTLDVAVSFHDSYGVTLLLGDGKGGLTLAPNSPIVMKDGQHPHTHGLALRDMNQDKKLDLVTINNADNDVSVSIGDGTGGFTIAPGSPFAVGPSPYPSAVGDVNGDGWPDIVATATATGPMRAQQLAHARALTLLLSDRKGGFRSSQLPLRTGEPWFAVIADINGDRKMDILATHHEMNQLTVMIGDGNGGFAEIEKSPFDCGSNLFHIVAADVNHDGKMDVAATTGNGVRFMLGDGKGGFTCTSPIVTGKGSWRLDVGDVNGDGKLDVVNSNMESGSISVLLGR